MERTHGVEPRAAEIEFDAVAEDRGGQRISVPREDVAPLGRDDLFGEDASGEPFGIVGDLRAEELRRRGIDLYDPVVPGEILDD